MIVCIGDVMVDVFPTKGGGERRHPGGKASNYAVMARALGSAAAVIGCIGSDQDGALVHNALESAGVDLSGLLVRDGVPTGTDCFTSGDWRIERGANMSLTAEDVRTQLRTLLVGAEVEAMIVNQGVARAASQAAVSLAREHDRFLVLHLGPEAVEEGRGVSPEYHSLADVIVVSRREAGVLSDQLGLGVSGLADAALARKLFDATSPRWALLLSLGVEGAHLVARRRDDIVEIAAPGGSGPDHDVENYIGAGDAMIAAWLALTLEKGQSTARDIKASGECLRRAIVLATLTLSYRGTMTAALSAPAIFVNGRADLLPPTSEDRAEGR